MGINEENKIIKHRLGNMSKSELMILANECGFIGEDLKLLIDCFCNKRSNTSIAIELNLCIDSVAKRKKKIVDRVRAYRLSLARGLNTNL
jgi:hypothetical protein